ncbi:MAG: VWA domain-containing protein [Thermoanaerobaculia bacterium]
MTPPGSAPNARKLAAAICALFILLAILLLQTRLAAQSVPRPPAPLQAPILAGSAAGLTIVSPPPGMPAFGAIEVVVDAGATVPRKIEFWFNGIKAGEVTRAPWLYTIDTGEDNIERRLRVVATDPGGQKREAEIFLPSVRVDDQLDLPLQQLYITATREGQPVTDLKRKQFAVFDLERRQEIVTFEHGDIPLTAVLLIDSSLSMVGPPLRAALAGAHSFAAGMAELDEAMLLLFSDRAVHSTPFTVDPDELLAGLDGTEAGGGSAVNDHLFLALQMLEKRQGRRVVILLSDGVDVESLLTASQVNEIAVRSQALIYWIRASSEPFDLLQRSAWRNVVEHSAEIRQLAAIVDASGGRRIDILRYEDAEGAFQKILTELRQQYVVGYYPKRSRHDGVWHPIRIDVEPKSVTLRARDGYYDD